METQNYLIISYMISALLENRLKDDFYSDTR